jgi:iron complex outermembrane receptor protein
MLEKFNNRLKTPNETPFKKSLLAVLVITCSGPTFAQSVGNDSKSVIDKTSDVTEEIVITGTRLSLENAQNIKRQAQTAVDAISASDISSLPDASALEALSRIPGITIERFAAPNDPDHFSVEGSGFTLRGLPQTSSQFNGRDTFSATNRRGLSFEDVSPELMSSVVVYKNHTADLIEGGISGTVNLNTRKPFDSGREGVKAAFTIKGIYGDFREDLSPSISGLFSDRWNTEIGDFGLLVSAAKTNINARADGIEIGKYKLDAGSQNWTPTTAGIRSTDTDREREARSVVLQWKNPNDNAELTFEYMGSKAGEVWLEHAFYADGESGVTSTDSVYTNHIFQRGTLENYSNLTIQTRAGSVNSKVDDYSLHLKLTPTDELTIDLDAQKIKAASDNTNLSVFGAIDVNIGMVTHGSSRPELTFTSPTRRSSIPSATYFTAPKNYTAQAKMSHLENNEGDEEAYRADLKYDLDASFTKSVEAGVRFAGRDQTSRYSVYNWGEVAEAWTGGRGNFEGFRDPESWDGVVDYNQPYNAPANGLYSFENFQRSSNSPIVGGKVLALSDNIVKNYQNYLAAVGHNAIAGAGKDLEDRDGVIPGTPYLPVEINPLKETNKAAYVKLNFETDAQDIDGNIGIRYVQLERESMGGTSFSEITAPQVPFPGGPSADITADQYAFSKGAQIKGALEGSFSKVLPSFNIKYEVNNDVALRFAASQSVAYPDLGLLRYSYPISATILTTEGPDPQNPANNIALSRKLDYWSANAGNPFLKPMESKDFDLSAEWYFSKVGYVSAAVFHKDISNFFATGTTDQNFTNSSGITQSVRVTGPVNQGTGKIGGLELAYQQFFDFLPAPFDGFGAQLNFTHLEPKSVPNQNTNVVDTSSSSTVLPFTGLPLQGLSKDSFNIAGFYEKDSLKARLAYNWRSSYLLTLRQVNLGLPVFSDATGNLDGSISYKLNDEFELGLEASNLLNTITHTSFQIDQAGTKLGRSWFEADRRFSVFIKGTF